MGFFDHLQKGGGFSLQPKKPQIRKVVQTRPAPPSRASSLTPGTSSRASPSDKPKKTQGSGSRSVSRDPDLTSSKRRLNTPSQNRKRQTPEQRLSSDDDSSDTDTSFEVRKRARTGDSAEPDFERRLRSLKAFLEGGVKSLPIVHAADITSVQKAGCFKPAFGGTGRPTEIFLQYPSVSPKERYNLVVPRDKDDFRPIDDIFQVIETVSQNYIPEDEADYFDNESTGIKRRLRRALAHASEAEFRNVVTDYNDAIERLRRDGSIAQKLDSTHRLNLPLVERILTQIYSRTVSPRVESLRQYENGTDNVYGELLPRFISTIFKETGLKSGQVFVDLGSGVGNVVLQAALEIGCESWGCEMMQNACELAELQQTEFRARCRLWGIAPGKTHLVRGDFLKEQSIIDVLKRADVILINNQAFTPQLNNELINHFLDMKEGCQIVSLKSFVPAGHKIQSRNLNSPINLLKVKRREYWSNSVSWTDVGGTYFIATKDSSRLRAFAESMG
ncbi:Histone methylation protein DOT1 [Aspergillus parasiticus SU-1]|uniref:Histone-lysine N-methyltransferase, H3 lysine-79 specific n=3 Tax=Aspergillus subgen. Circumdati TaxID=2720871 RepID=A0A5N6D4R0_ASPPA|nr:S-adenosyl-L-methionine-dependent methyltransferase [Aspergillus parasiticus]KAE8310710.1 S-adenosyl-L-methionine-dependent methyltransferase [Aspergillus transmontanensis]KJK68480.1 Histone methylation protein DOT1 [Aspergillus parasiticus SU-1]